MVAVSAAELVVVVDEGVRLAELHLHARTDQTTAAAGVDAVEGCGGAAADVAHTNLRLRVSGFVYPRTAHFGSDGRPVAEAEGFVDPDLHGDGQGIVVRFSEAVCDLRGVLRPLAPSVLIDMVELKPDAGDEPELLRKRDSVADSGAYLEAGGVVFPGLVTTEEDVRSVDIVPRKPEARVHVGKEAGAVVVAGVDADVEGVHIGRREAVVVLDFAGGVGGGEAGNEIA